MERRFMVRSHWFDNEYHEVSIKEIKELVETDTGFILVLDKVDEENGTIYLTDAGKWGF
jgi:hypothetical protein